MTNYLFNPVGYVCCAQQYRFEAPRQGVFADNEGIIRMNPGNNFEQALADLSGFERIWVIYCFHLNNNWKPLVRPPVAGMKEKVSVFATRAPHRPNPIGLSCVELVKIDKLELLIRNFDMLDGTPVLDVKPYIPAVDAFPNCGTGWLKDATAENYTVTFGCAAAAKAEWIQLRCGLDLVNFCSIQLSHEPLNFTRKRLNQDESGLFIISCRMWRIHFSAECDSRQVMIKEIESGYTAAELNQAEDQYQDKEVHRGFCRRFNLE
jgi:tRNA-Thr(GGU) m(6)t(6)A37 methyltransferase TsaA